MAVDPEEGLVTDLMLGVMIAFGADAIILVGAGLAVGFFSTTVFAAVTTLVVAVFALWIGWRWRAIKKVESAERDALEELKHRYARGELSDEEFERKLDALVDAQDSDEIELRGVERPTEKSK
ncbi:hypothetical protein BRD15_07245 [Halobacteriales archaeon SW_6_65_15]|nr:MAG: hypothetical protein BRD15_07245 [Halobacteriales archaeon SW_6_65_15]